MRHIRSVIAVAATIVAMPTFYIPAMADSSNGPVEVKGLKNGYNGVGL